MDALWRNPGELCSMVWRPANFLHASSRISLRSIRATRWRPRRFTRYGFERSPRIFLNSPGPLRSRRFRLCRSSSDADEGLILSISSAASSAALARLPFVVGRAIASACSRRSLIASERDRPWSAAHRSTARVSSSESWIAETGPRPAAGRPRSFRDFFAIDRVLAQKASRAKGCAFRGRR
jgi:hypothetical protein